MAATSAPASLETSLTRLGDDGRALLFTEARTANTFSDRPVTSEQLREIYELMKWAPTWANTAPLRIVYVTTSDGTARLLKHLQPGNVGQATQAPVNAILAADRASTTRSPACFPSAPGCGTLSKQTQGCGTRSAPAARGCRPPTSSSPSAPPAWPPGLW